MRLILIILLFLPSFVFGQVIGGSGTCEVQSNPNTISDLDSQPVSECKSVYWSGNRYEYNPSGTIGVDRWIIADNSDGVITGHTVTGTNTKTSTITRSIGGNIVETWTDNDTQLTTEEVQDAVGSMVAGNTETDITVTYNDASNKLNFVVNDGTTVNDITNGIDITENAGEIEVDLDINELGAMTIFDPPNDYAAIYDASVGFERKMSIEDIRDGAITNVIIDGYTITFTGNGTAFDGTIVIPDGDMQLTQTSHGFLAGDVPIACYSTPAGVITEANTTAGNTLHSYFISQVIDANTFKITTGRPYALVSHGYTVGEYYFLQDNGSYSTTADADFEAPVFYVVNQHNLILLNDRPSSN